MEEMKQDLGTTCRLEADVLVDLQFCRASKLACESESRGGTDSWWILNGVRCQCVAMGSQRQATQRLSGEKHWSQPTSGARVRAARGQPASGGRSA
ncbi:hypothetical protein E2562_037270 [Oryza meyeriana var. granulata]|uniref:Uncharacterized protein n=1 Tax=Oryza meyeriana var. granulata TaxID=110450 RepID=A0A6G1ED24_9ORYZ|nr:hypothetical protein E2562_037270 [Oryza meyeriana var. granulata]